jgi:hypothetical protein
MKILTIGDLQGLPDWKKANPDDFDLIVFLGDYLDSPIVKDKEMITNLKEIISLKSNHPEKVKLLLGNHEISYLYRQYRASGYRYEIGEKVKKLLNRHLDLFQVAFQVDTYLWTHAGIHQEYYNQRLLPFIQDSDKTLAETLKRLYTETYDPLFEVGYERGGRNRKSVGGLFWVDSRRLLEKPLQGYHQMVGHTPVKTIEHHFPYENDPDTSVTLCDCIEYGDKSFYELEI